MPSPCLFSSRPTKVAQSTEAKCVVAIVCSLQSTPKMRHLDRSKRRRRFCPFSPKRPKCVISTEAKCVVALSVLSKAPQMRHLDRSKMRRRFVRSLQSAPNASSRPKQNASSLLSVLSKAPPKCVISTEAKCVVAFVRSLQSAPPQMRHLDRSSGLSHLCCVVERPPHLHLLLFSVCHPRRASAVDALVCWVLVFCPCFLVVILPRSRRICVCFCFRP